jgi:hypothetical protein
MVPHPLMALHDSGLHRLHVGVPPSLHSTRLRYPALFGAGQAELTYVVNVQHLHR